MTYLNYLCKIITACMYFVTAFINKHSHDNKTSQYYVKTSLEWKDHFNQADWLHIVIKMTAN